MVLLKKSLLAITVMLFVMSIDRCRADAVQSCIDEIKLVFKNYFPRIHFKWGLEKLSMKQIDSLKSYKYVKPYFQKLLTQAKIFRDNFMSPIDWCATLPERNECEVNIVRLPFDKNAEGGKVFDYLYEGYALDDINLETFFKDEYIKYDENDTKEKRTEKHLVMEENLKKLQYLIDYFQYHIKNASVVGNDNFQYVEEYCEDAVKQEASKPEDTPSSSSTAPVV